MPKIPKKAKCQADAQKFAVAVQQVLASGRLPELIDAFESDKKANFHKILDEIGIGTEVKDMMKKGAFSNDTVTFKWF